MGMAGIVIDSMGDVAPIIVGVFMTRIIIEFISI